MSRNKEHRGAAFGVAFNGAAAFGGRPIGSVFFVSAHLFFYYAYSCIFLIYCLYIPYIFQIYFLNIFHICSLVCFLIYSVNRRQVLIAKPRSYSFSTFHTFYIFYQQFHDFQFKSSIFSDVSVVLPNLSAFCPNHQITVLPSQRILAWPSGGSILCASHRIWLKLFRSR